MREDDCASWPNRSMRAIKHSLCQLGVATQPARHPCINRAAELI